MELIIIFVAVVAFALAAVSAVLFADHHRYIQMERNLLSIQSLN